MTEQRQQGPGEKARPIPRDMPDQQARNVEDPWDVRTAQEESERTPDTGKSANDVPDTDEAGTGRQGAPQSGTVHPEHPVPDEPSD
ncbi:hypothetical protein ABZ876_36650 [Streptomyces sp. NPDC046931]|uniref:hypothetical protein n=1 Tax=Streptomyces sp. NPDC046931 TaxID=3154806 RepID=UPI0033D3A4A6